MNDRRLSMARSQAFRTKGWLEHCADSSLGRWVAASQAAWAGRKLYRGLLWLRTGGKGFRCALPAGEVVWVLPELRYVTWNEDEYRAFREAVTPGSVVLDVGANVGNYSVLFGQWVGTTGRVFAFEPDVETCHGLRRHIELNGLARRVTPLQLAVSSSKGEAFFATDGVSGTHRLAAKTKNSKGHPVATTSVDAFCAEQGIRPTVIKIDVEGAELDVLRGARETLKNTQEAKVFVEMHPRIWPQIGIARKDVEEELRQQGFRAEPLAACADPWVMEGVCLRLVREK